MKYKLIIFDLDGTILNTLADLMASCNYALAAYQLPSITLEQTKSYIGNGIKSLMLQASNQSSQIEELLKLFKSYYSQHYSVLTMPYEGISEVFEYCKENGIYIGVLTNKVEDIAVKLIEKHFPNTMDFVYGEIPNRPRKPDPTFLNSILKQYGVASNQVLYVGDSEVDVLVCENAKIDGIFVSYGYRDKVALQKLTSRIVDSAKQLKESIGEK